MSKRTEAHADNIAPEMSKYAKPDMSVHGDSGPISVTHAPVWERGLVDRLESIRENGWQLVQDMNAGNPIGFGPIPTSSRASYRVASTAYLAKSGANLVVKTNAAVERIIFEGKVAVGVQTASELCKDAAVTSDQGLP